MIFIWFLFFPPLPVLVAAFTHIQTAAVASSPDRETGWAGLPSFLSRTASEEGSRPCLGDLRPHPVKGEAAVDLAQVLPFSIWVLPCRYCFYLWVLALLDRRIQAQPPFSLSFSFFLRASGISPYVNQDAFAPWSKGRIRRSSSLSVAPLGRSLF